MNTRFTFMIAVTGILLLTITFSNAIAQSKSKFPGTGVQSSNGCLSCPGSEWNDASNITQNDAQFATTFLSQKGFCFQTVCFYSRGLIGSNFGFNIPASATIKGIVVRINRKADTTHSVKDSSIQLLKANTLVGLKKKLNGYWTTAAKTVVYGGPTDLWGSTWTPGDVNNSGFGTWLKCFNNSTNTPQASVNYFRITVYYSDSSGMKEQTVYYDFSGKELKIYPNPAADKTIISFEAPNEGTLTLSVFNEMGEAVQKISEEVQEGLFVKEIDLNSLPSGNYFVRCDMQGRSWFGSIIKE